MSSSFVKLSEEIPFIGEKRVNSFEGLTVEKSCNKSKGCIKARDVRICLYSTCETRGLLSGRKEECVLYFVLNDT